MQRGQIWWADLPDPAGSETGFRRPVLIVQSDLFTRSRIATIVAVAITSNLILAKAPGNVLLSARQSGLPKDSVANVSQIITLDKSMLVQQAGQLSARTMATIDDGIRLVLSL